MSGNELPKVIDKSQADIDAAIAVIKASDIPNGTKDFAISCIRLAVWLPKALLEHKIKLSNLRKLIFGFGRKNNKKSKNDVEPSSAKDLAKTNDANLPAETDSSKAEAPVTTNRVSAPVMVVYPTLHIPIQLSINYLFTF